MIGEISPGPSDNAGKGRTISKKISCLIKNFGNSPKARDESSVVKENVEVFEGLSSERKQRSSFMEKLAKFKNRTKSYSKPNLVRKSEIEQSSSIVKKTKQKFLGLENFAGSNIHLIAPKKKSSTADGSQIRKSLKLREIYVKVLPTDSPTEMMTAKAASSALIDVVDLEVPGPEVEKEFEEIYKESGAADKTELEIESEFEKIYQKAS